jgi:iron complex outermembrane receptor protein
MSAGTDIVIKGKKRASLYLLADNLLDTAWQSHLSRLKEVGIYNMGRNITVKLMVPIP